MADYNWSLLLSLIEANTMYSNQSGNPMPLLYLLLVQQKQTVDHPAPELEESKLIIFMIKQRHVLKSIHLAALLFFWFMFNVLADNSETGLKKRLVDSFSLNKVISMVSRLCSLAIV